MSERTKDLLFPCILFLILIGAFGKILFTGQIVRAPDIINEFYWGVLRYQDMPLTDLFRLGLKATWNQYINSGFTVEGGTASQSFLFLQRLVFWVIPAPASVAWYMVLHLFVGGAGMYCLCRLIGTSRYAALLAGAVFAFAPEIASLINAGHVMKIATISMAPWAFCALEKGFRERRLIWFLATGLVLAFQFFHTHWQIAYYTCLCIGAYAAVRFLGMVRSGECGSSRGVLGLAAMNLATLVFFLSTVAISLLPLANWSTDTTRGIGSGSNAGKGGLEYEEAMSWSLPPEELVSFVIPGFFGFSRQEAGPNPDTIPAYYWGRMVFTQTSSYLGLLPWLLAPLPLLFRRDRYTWLALAGVVGGLLFAMGKYTPFYRLLFEFFPGVNHFRVPKMILFIPVMGLGVLAARGLDLLMDERIRSTRAFRQYLFGAAALPVALFILFGSQVLARSSWMSQLAPMIARPTMYQEGAELVLQRWTNLLQETVIAASMALACAATFWAVQRRWLTAATVPVLLLAVFLADVGRVNGKFLFLVDVPVKATGRQTPTMDFLRARGSALSRVLPMNGVDPMVYATRQIPVLFTSNPVQQQRWQNYLDGFVFPSAMPDMVNLKYLVYEPGAYARDKGALGDKFVPVFRSPDGRELVLENRSVLPKAWLVPAVQVVTDPAQAVARLGSPGFDPRRLALVETPPPVALPGAAALAGAGSARITDYGSERIVAEATTAQPALLVFGEKYYRGWRATVDGVATHIHPVNHVLRGVYLSPGNHRVEMVFDPVPFKVGKWLTLVSFALFAVLLAREIRLRRKGSRPGW